MRSTDAFKLGEQITLQYLGATVVFAAPGVPEWEQGYKGGNAESLLEAMLHPTKGLASS
jgi:hypothetical protein